MISSLNKPIFDILATINRSPDFYVYQKTKAFFPTLHIVNSEKDEDKEEIALPLCKTQAKQIITRCSKAPYGKGLQTLVDDSVRNTWELDASDISQGNKKWQTFLKQILRHCEKQLDLQGQTLVAHPYKLLLYEAGSFFLAHQDTEKEDNMVATLVIALPSAHQGGELTISSQHQSVCIDFSREENLHTFQSVLFYADCQHEIAPVTSGYRLVLTYNITLKGQRKLSTLDYSKQEKALSLLIKNWQEQLTSKDTKYLAISLDHQYSADGFSLNSLKGVDRSRADVLLRSAEQTGCKAYICLLEKYEMFEAWEEDEIGSLLEDYITVSNLIDSTDTPENKLTISRLHDDDILRHYDLDDETAIEEDFEGYMGNYGNTLSRWYRHAAVIFWPNAYHLEVLARNDISSAITYLKQQQVNNAVDLPRDLNTLFALLEERRCTPRDDNFLLLTVILKHKHTELAKHYCDHFLFSQQTLPSISQSHRLIKQCGWDYLQASIGSEDNQTSEKRMRLLEWLNKIKAKLIWHEQPALEALVLTSIANSIDKSHWQFTASNVFKLIFPLCLAQTNQKTINQCAVLLSRFLDKQGRQLKPENEILPYLEKAYQQPNSSDHDDNYIIFNTVINWLTQQFAPYYERSKQQPDPAPTEAIPQLSCHCEHCKDILNFMRSKAETIELKKLKAQCEHLSEQMQEHQVEAHYQINKNRRPWRFILRKFGADQRKKISDYEKAKSLVERLEALR